MTERGCATCAYLCGSLSHGGGLWGGGGAAQNVRKRPRDHRRDRVRGLGRGDRRGRFRGGRRGARVGRHSAEGYYVGTSRRGCLRVVPPTPGSGWWCHWRGSNFDASAKGSGSSGRRARAHGPCSAGLFWRLGAIDEVRLEAFSSSDEFFGHLRSAVDRAQFAKTRTPGQQRAVDSSRARTGKTSPGQQEHNRGREGSLAEDQSRAEPSRASFHHGRGELESHRGA